MDRVKEAEEGEAEDVGDEGRHVHARVDTEGVEATGRGHRGRRGRA